MAFKSKADRAAYDKRRREARKNGTTGPTSRHWLTVPDSEWAKYEAGAELCEQSVADWIAESLELFARWDLGVWHKCYDDCEDPCDMIWHQAEEPEEVRRNG